MEMIKPCDLPARYVHIKMSIKKIRYSQNVRSITFTEKKNYIYKTHTIEHLLPILPSFVANALQNTYIRNHTSMTLIRINLVLKI